MKKSPKDLKPGEYLWIDKGIFARANKKGIQYGISYTFRGERKRELVGPTITLARQALSIRKAEIAQGKYKIPNKIKSPSFDELADRYLEYAKKAKRSWKRDDGALKKARIFFGKKQIDKITAWDIERYRAKRTKTVTRATANRDLSLLKYMFRLAVDWGMLEINPAKSVKSYKEEEKSIRVLSAEEERKLIEASAPHLKPIIILALNTGLRRGELLSLEWEQVDLRRRILTVEHSKSGRVRHVPLNDYCIKTLTELGDKRKGSIFTFKGNPILSVRKSFETAKKKAGIQSFRFHDLRHTFATKLALAGVDLKRIKILVGHSNISMTEKYAHPAPEDLRAAVDNLVQSGTKVAPKVSRKIKRPA